jgi:hypothetical protein
MQFRVSHCDCSAPSHARLGDSPSPLSHWVIRASSPSAGALSRGEALTDAVHRGPIREGGSVAPPGESLSLSLRPSRRRRRRRGQPSGSCLRTTLTGIRAARAAHSNPKGSSPAPSHRPAETAACRARNDGWGQPRSPPPLVVQEIPPAVDLGRECVHRKGMDRRGGGNRKDRGRGSAEHGGGDGAPCVSLPRYPDGCTSRGVDNPMEDMPSRPAIASADSRPIPALAR